MIANFKSISRKTTAAAFALLIAVCFISLSLSCASKVKQVQTESKSEPQSAYMLTDLDEPPRVLRSAMPMYPYEAAKNGIEGKVVVKMVVTKEGIAVEPEVVKYDPEEIQGIFDESALEVVKKYAFKPGMKGGKAVDCIVRMPIVFKMAPKPPPQPPKQP